MTETTTLDALDDALARVSDGSVPAGAGRPEPSNTIAALSHRFAEQLIAEA